MLQARHTAGLLLSLAILITGCGGGGGGDGQAAQEPPPTSPGPPDTPDPPDPPDDPTPPTPTVGLDARPSNTTCIAPERATGDATIGVERVFPNIRFQDSAGVTSNPLFLGQAPNDRSRWFVLERFGAARVFDNNPAVSTYSTFLDIAARVESTCAECGLLGMAFHPDFPRTPRVYITYTSVQRGNAAGPDTHLSEFTSPDGGLTLDPASERILMTIYKPSVHHHGGNIIFGRDGYLYFATGDGNSARRNDAQDLRTILDRKSVV